MGITVNDFFENIYSVIFSPKAFFERDDLKISVRLALGTVVFIAILTKLSYGILDNSILKITFIFSLIWHVLMTVLVWFLTALFFEYTAKIFGKDGNLNKLLFLTAFAPIPYIFFSPLNLLKNLGGTGYIISSFIEFFLYLWIIILYAYSLRATYNLTLSRSFMLIFLPFIASFFAMHWTVCFISKLWYIFSI